MKILALDSTAGAASAALVEENKIIGEFFIHTALTHSQTLVPMVEDLLKNTQCAMEEIDAFAVSTGPGSFTGVRIGVSAVKGMAMALNKPCIPVSTLAAMAENLTQSDCLAVCVMDARCNQVYNANFQIRGGQILRTCEDRALSVSQLMEELKPCREQILLVGDGAQLCYRAFQKELNHVMPAPPRQRYQNASGVAFAAQKVYNEQGAVSADRLVPSYLRLPQAERELKKKMGV